MARYVIDNRPAAIEFESAGASILRRTLQNCKNLLMLRMGELPYDRLRGFDPALFDLPIVKLNEVLVPELDRVMMWEPDADVVDGTAMLDENGECIITAILEINV